MSGMKAFGYDVKANADKLHKLCFKTSIQLSLCNKVLQRIMGPDIGRELRPVSYTLCPKLQLFMVYFPSTDRYADVLQLRDEYRSCWTTEPLLPNNSHRSVQQIRLRHWSKLAALRPRQSSDVWPMGNWGARLLVLRGRRHSLLRTSEHTVSARYLFGCFIIYFHRRTCSDSSANCPWKIRKCGKFLMRTRASCTITPRS